MLFCIYTKNICFLHEEKGAFFMKKKLALALTAIMALSAVPAYAGVPAAPTASKVTVNGEAKAFEAYNINICSCGVAIHHPNLPSGNKLYNWRKSDL